MERQTVTTGIMICKEQEPESPTAQVRFTPGSLLAQRFGVDGNRKPILNKI
jgi:hypothetical protein